jgi:methyl-accepting chemotaxis protein
LFQRKNAADNFVHSEALRNAVNQQLQDAAESSANLLGVYAVFEPNQLDGRMTTIRGRRRSAPTTRGVSPAIGPGSTAR